MLNKHCPKCNQDLPKSSFTSTQAKYCIACKRIDQLEKRNEMMRRSIERKANKKPIKTVVQPLPALKKTAQKLVNKFCRERDRKDGLICISCQKKTIDHGGHFWPMGSNSALRFNEWNINGQCEQCNFREHGNLLNYRINLVKKIGKENVEWLDEHHSDIKKWTREEIENVIKTYTQKIKEL